ncbi:hypothetical protein [Sediminicoccus rosea]|uniref:Poly(3-hydroxyalkanoate) polymerase subunit PhaE n=1 Tax=Sediminicoccus rosea TaxID=1225128 RepID=A0ABZ0PI61_9PROT|nr:hypothetical protein [Sediminicoccus rosea]WPB85310.1 hypothetical protein R9Z33_00205 [Sediminicoccus rosea]
MNSPEDLDRLAADWIALWESELAGLGQDAELAEAWSASVALMAAFWRAQSAQMAAAAKWQAPHEPGTPSSSPAGPAPAQPAPDPGRQPGDGGDDDAAALRARLAELERRLAALEGGPGGGSPDRRKPRAPRRKP